MADANKHPNAISKMLWGMTELVHRFPEKNDTTAGKLGMVLRRAEDFTAYEIVASFASKLRYLKVYGYPLGLSSFAQVSLYSMTARSDLDGNIPLIFDMRVKYVARIVFYTPDTDGTYRAHVITVGMGELLGWEQVNDVILGLDVWDVPTATSGEIDGVGERQPLIHIESNPVGEGFYVVAPRHDGDYVELDGNIGVEDTGPHPFHIRYVDVFEKCDYVDEWIVSREGWWMERELLDGNVILDNPEYIYQHYQVPQGDVVLSFAASPDVVFSVMDSETGAPVYTLAVSLCCIGKTILHLIQGLLDICGECYTGSQMGPGM